MLRLDAVNRILVAAQMPTVTTLSSPDRLVAKAITILDDIVLQTCEKGWDFNTDYEYPFVPVAPLPAELALTSTMLAVDVLGGGYGPMLSGSGATSTFIGTDNAASPDIVVRNGKLYDRTTRSYLFSSTVNAIVVWAITFDNLPLVFQEYVVTASAVKFAFLVSVDPQTAAALRIEEARAWAALKQRDTQQSSANALARYPISVLASGWPRLRGLN